MSERHWRILIVDDQDGWCEAIASVLEDIECSVKLAKTFKRALTELGSQEFDLVIIDIRLEEQVDYNVEGIDLLQEMWKHGKGPPAIILTGYGTPALRQKAEWYGAFAFLEKSDDESGFDRGLFLKTVKEAIAASTSPAVPLD